MIPVISFVSVTAGVGVSAGADEAEGELDGASGGDEEVLLGDVLAEFPFPDHPQPAVKAIKAHKPRVPIFLVTFVITEVHPPKQKAPAVPGYREAGAYLS
jgi:hypothetical protein